MRFFLLARARSSGLVRLLSERAYESRSAAVEAASATASAGAIDLGDDEVLAVDLDAAGPVLVLRVQAPAHAVPAAPETHATPIVGVIPPAGLFSPAAPTPPSCVPRSSAEEDSESAGAELEPAVRLQPRFPLFGADDEPPEVGLSETLRRVARRMETDLTLSGHTEWVAADDSWDARTLDDYALPDDAHLSGARDEGRLRIDAAECLRNDEAALSREADDRRHRYDAEAGFRYEDEARAAADQGEAGESDRGHDVLLEPGPWTGDEMSTEALDADLPMADDRTLDLRPAYLEEAFEPVVFAKPAIDETLQVDDMDVTDALLAEPGTDTFRLEAGRESDTTPFDGERVLDAVTSEPDPAPYRPAILDFAMWVCADCVYQRTCRKAGVASPATCGTFQWRSF